MNPINKIRWRAKIRRTWIAAACASVIAACATEYEPIPDFTRVGAVTALNPTDMPEDSIAALNDALDQYADLNRQIGKLSIDRGKLIEDINETVEKYKAEPDPNFRVPASCAVFNICSRKQLWHREYAEQIEELEELDSEIENLLPQLEVSRQTYYFHLVSGVSQGLYEVSDSETYIQKSRVQSTPIDLKSGQEIILRFKPISLDPGLEITIELENRSKQVFRGDDLYLTNGYSNPIAFANSPLRVSLFDAREEPLERVPLKDLIEEVYYLDIEQATASVGEAPSGELNEKRNNEVAVGGYNEGLCGLGSSDDSRRPIRTSIIGQVVMFNTEAVGATPLGTAFRIEDDYVVSAGHVLADHLAQPGEALDLELLKDRIAYIQVWFDPVIDVAGTPVHNARPEHRFFIDPSSLACSECALDSPGFREPKNKPGDDWAIFRLKPNVVTKKTVAETFPNEPGIRISADRDSLPEHDSFYIMGFGLSDKPQINLKMQIGSGAVLKESLNPDGIPWLRHLIDTRRGSSGGPVFEVASSRDGGLGENIATIDALREAVAVGIHAGGYCEMSSAVEERRDNEATSFNSPRLRKVLEYRGLLAADVRVASK